MVWDFWKIKNAMAAIRIPVQMPRKQKGKELPGCYACEMDCKRGLLNKIKPYGFTLFIKRYGIESLLDCLEENEKRGILYHRKRELLAIMMILTMWKS